MKHLVHFNAFDLSYIAMFAERQNAVKAASNAVTKRHDQNKTEFELHYIGAMGERAVSLFTGASMDERVHIGGDAGVDMTINGWDCHIKTYTYGGRNIEFYIDNMDCFTAPVGVFTHVVSPTQVVIDGCIGRKKFRESCRKKDYGYGERLYVTPSELTDIEILQEKGNERLK